MPTWDQRGSEQKALAVSVIFNVCVNPSCEPGYCPRCGRQSPPYRGTWYCGYWETKSHQAKKRQMGLGL